MITFDNQSTRIIYKSDDKYVFCVKKEYLYELYSQDWRYPNKTLIFNRLIAQERDYLIVETNGILSIYDCRWNSVIFETKSEIAFFSSNFFLVKKGNCWVLKGNCDWRLNNIIDIPFDEIHIIHTLSNKSYFATKTGNYWSLYDQTGKLLLNGHIEQIREITNEFEVVAVLKEGQWTEVSLYEDENICFHPLVEGLNDIEDVKKIEGFTIGVKRKGKWGVFALAEQSPILPFNFDNLKADKGCCTIVQIDNSWGVYWHEELIIPIKFDNIMELEFYRSFVVQKNSLLGIYKDKDLILPLNYSDIKELSNNIIALKKHNLWELYDLKEEKVIFDKIEIYEYHNDAIIIRKDNKYGLYNLKKGYLDIPIIFNEITLVHENLYKTRIGNIFGVIYKDVHFSSYKFIEPQFDEIYDYNHFIGIRKNMHYGLCNKFGDLVLDFVYDKIIINKNPKDEWGKFYYLTVFINGKCGLYKCSRCGCANEILPIKFDNINLVTYAHKIFDEYSYIIVQKENRFGIYDINGEEILPIEYEQVGHIAECRMDCKKYDAFCLKINNRYGVITRDNKKEIIPTIFDFIEYDKHDFLCKYNNHIYKFNDKGLRNHYGALEYLRTDVQYNSFCNDKNSADLINYGF